MKLSKVDRDFLVTLDSYLSIDAVVAQLKERKLHDCQCFSNADVRFAFMQWLKHHLESIENDASHFVRENSKHFNKHLDLDELQVADYDDGFSEMSDEEFIQMSIDMYPNYISGLEADFGGDAEGAKAALGL